jgi:adenine/guanine phosphoribosyltransferase-like PRPP-binding protein
MGEVMCKVICEEEFRTKLYHLLTGLTAIKSVSGPGRSGAIAAVYTSHYLGVPFIPYGQRVPHTLRPHLVVDTAVYSGATLRKATRKMSADIALGVYSEPPRVKFWYERW